MFFENILSDTMLKEKITTSKICVVRSNFEKGEIEISDILETIKLLLKYIKKNRKRKTFKKLYSIRRVTLFFSHTFETNSHYYYKYKFYSKCKVNPTPKCFFKNIMKGNICV
ncbi:MAG: hypothetical protein QG640_699 [Patescibacteria group bacterium]|nr:hypothetical protein [Patescibacteria group bacterium]